LAGDPSDMVLLDETHMLLAGYNSHDLHVVDATDGSIKQSLKADWDIPGGGPIFPWTLTALGDGRYAVTHQGYSADFMSTTTGAIFEVRWDGKKLSVVDQDADKAKVQGHVLKSHLPQNLYKQSDGTFVVIGLCGEWA